MVNNPQPLGCVHAGRGERTCWGLPFTYGTSKACATQGYADGLVCDPGHVGQAPVQLHQGGGVRRGGAACATGGQGGADASELRLALKSWRRGLLVALGYCRRICTGNEEHAAWYCRNIYGTLTWDTDVGHVMMFKLGNGAWGKGKLAPTAHAAHAAWRTGRALCQRGYR